MLCELCNAREAHHDIQADTFTLSICDECYGRKYRTSQTNLVQPLNTKGQQTINKTGYGILYNMGQYTNKQTGVTRFDFVTLIYRLTMTGLLVGAFLWIGKIFLTGSMF